MPPYKPRLEEGQAYEVLIRNLSRLVRSGFDMSEAGRMVLEKAGLRRFPRRSYAPPSQRPTKKPTVH